MNRLLVVALAAALALISCKNDQPAIDNIIHLAPGNAAVIVKINDLDRFKSELINNEFLQVFKDNDNFKKSESLLNSLQYISPKGESLLCLNEIGKSNFEYTFITRNHNDLFAIDSTIARNIQEIDYESRSIKQLTIGDDEIFSITLGEYFIGSSSRLLIENTIRNIEKPFSNPELNKLFLVAQKNHASTLFIDNKRVPQLLEGIFNTEFSDSFQKISDWTSLDLEISADAILGNGIALASDSIHNLLNDLKHKDGDVTGVQQIIPATMEYYIDLGNSEHLLATPVKENDSLFKYVTEATFIQLNDGTAYAFNSEEPLQFEERLKPYITNTDSYRNETIWQLSENDLIATHFKKFFPKASVGFASYINEYFIFTENEETLKSIISNIQNHSVLARLTAYDDLKKGMAGVSNIEIVGNLESMKENHHIFSDEFSDYIRKKDLSSQNFIGIQYTTEDDFSHLNLYTRKNNTSRSSSGLITQVFNTTLDAEITGRPQFVINHRTKQKEVVVQDIKNDLYLISTHGKVLWKKRLDGQINGKIEQVDLYRNGRLQLAFVTTGKLYIIDRNGNDVSPFPINFEKPITQPLALFDYDKNKDYRFLIVSGADVTMLDRDGKKVSGFNFTKAGSKIINTPQHIRVGSKDYIVMQEENGKLDILHRTGDSRITVKDNIDFSGNQVYWYQDKFATTNNNGDLVMVDEAGRVTPLPMNLKPEHQIDATVNTLASISENTLSIKDNTVEMDFGIYTKPRIFYYYDKIYVGLTDLQAKQTYLFDSSGNSIQNFPVFGNGDIDLDDIDNDRKMELVTKGESNNILVYKIN
ncbi:ribonuclease HII [Robertkochia solimangrovi]|uniref:ribonuclease HII n=1 Tax=Robertkochia solimangrovi TaxID=2213046 RepID=UPI00117ED13D|nr:ribonuclease HII [Robertkochia solimangrovi]TRZ43086.1 ribonuclease HII [Robertkochia solimangrovi]